MRIALTVGDCAGIGPELAVRLAADPEFSGAVVLYGPPSVIAAAAERFAPGSRPSVEPVGDLTMADFVPGEASARCGRAAYETVRRAAADALSGRADAVVTAPVNKYAVNLAGVPFTGHTELIAAMCGVEDYAMMQSAAKLHVAFVTTHIALAEVSAAVTADRIRKVTFLLNAALREEGVAEPKIAMAALNPHAGENGHMGSEDERVVKPVCAELRASGIALDGPFPPDTLFIASTLNRYDGVVAMYHDQGHIPFKMLAFDQGVNSTLGLPIVRTSPDHGTAFEIAWRGIANPGSIRAAMRLAMRRAAARGSR